MAFSSSLSLLVVHGILLKINPCRSEIDLIGNQGNFQILPPPGCEHTLDLDALAMTRRMWAGVKRFSFSRAFKTVPADHKCHTWAQYLLSPDEKYPIQINGTGPPSQAMTRRWIISACEDTRDGGLSRSTTEATKADAWVPSFKLVASVGLQFRRTQVKDNKIERFLSLHPFLPIIAICRLAVISLWKFMEKSKSPRTIFPHSSHSNTLIN